MRAVVVAVVLSCVHAVAFAAPPREYDCEPGQSDRTQERCQCPPEFRSERNTRNDAVCVPKPASTPRRREPPPPSAILVAPASGAVGVDETTEFSATIVSGGYGVIEICSDLRCDRPRLLIHDAPDLGVATARITGLPPGQVLYWRARARDGRGAYSEIRMFVTAAARTDIDLKRVDALIGAGHFAEARGLVTVETDPATRLAVAVKLSQANQCAEMLLVVDDARRKRDGTTDPQFAQLGIECNARVAVALVKSKVDAGDFDGAGAIADNFTLRNGGDSRAAAYMGWARAYIYAARGWCSIELATGRRTSMVNDQIEFATTVGVSDFASLQPEIAEMCRAHQAIDESRTPRVDGGGGYAAWTYAWPVSGDLSPKGYALSVGGFGILENGYVRMGGELTALRPGSGGIEGRLGSMYTGGLRIHAGMREPAPLLFRIDGGVQMGYGWFDTATGERGAFVAVFRAGPALELALGKHMFIGARGVFTGGTALDFGDLEWTTDGLGDRAHGLLGFEFGAWFGVK